LKIQPQTHKIHTNFSSKSDIEESFANANRLFSNWKRLNTAATSKSHSLESDELKWSASELSSVLRTLDEDLKDLEDTIKIVEVSPTKFRLDPGQISLRKDFISKMKRNVAEIKSALARPRSVSAQPTSSQNNPSSGSSTPKTSYNKPAPPVQRGMSDRDVLLGSSRGGGVVMDRFGRTDSDYKQSNTKFIEREHGMQQEIMREQDDQLDQVASTVGNLKEIAVVMNSELDDQAAYVI
jgi:hypothetical protein